MVILHVFGMAQHAKKLYRYMLIYLCVFMYILKYLLNSSYNKRESLRIFFNHDKKKQNI